MVVEDRSALAASAYLYGFPLVFNLEQVERYVTTGVGANAAAPFNSFSHARTLAGPEDTFVTINNDTLYSMAQLDLGVGPVLLHVPDTGGRYYVLQFVDAWTNNFAYVGHRATGTGPGDFLLVPPGWSSETPRGATVIRLPTHVASIVGRWACAGPGDFAEVHALQDATTLTPSDPTAQAAGLPVPDPDVPQDLLFFEKLRLWSQAFPPAPRDEALQASFAPLGLAEDGASPYVSAEADLGQSLRDGYAAGGQNLQKALTSGSSPEVNGWKLTFHAFDYNLDYFEVGALDDDRFEDLRSPPEDHRAGRGCQGRTVGQPPLRSGLHHGLRRRPRRAAHWGADLHPAPGPDPAGRRVLVPHHVRHPELLPRRQPHRPLLHR